MKKSLIVLILIVVFAPLALVVGADINMKPALFAAGSHPANQVGEMFAEAFEKTTNREVKITICPYNAVGPSVKVLEPNKPGTADMSSPTPGQLYKYFPKFNYVMILFILDSREHADKVPGSKFIPWAAKEIEPLGPVFLSNRHWGFRNLTNNTRAVNNPKDV